MDSGPAPTQNTGMANCYVFKSRLQEYAQKAGFTTPEYHTVKEGPSHDPIFKSTVVVNNVSYESLPGFCNRKAAEQSAAEIALIEIVKSGQMTDCIPSVHETGLCKNLLQEYAQKMNYAIPSYVCNKQSVGPAPYVCTVDIGGIQYIGAAAKTKKEAEIKAARTALLAIQSQSENGMNGTAQLTVLPVRKKLRESNEQKITDPDAKKLKAKKKKFKKKQWVKKKLFKNSKVTGDGTGEVANGEVANIEGDSNAMVDNHNTVGCERDGLNMECDSGQGEEQVGLIEPSSTIVESS